ncbi:acyltransferase family protein [Microbacterium sp. P06]|uniref:acyltransferase family protein n=1 Tax=Microbacterium sp. P06 TaxID=3366949 RepID=UPI0037473505
MRPTIDRATSTPVLPSLTGLRWVAALVVFAFHVRNAGYFDIDGGRVMTALFGAGATGVSLFFVLSGFVLEWASRSGRDTSIPSFWRHRIARIYPLHVATVALALVLAATVVPSIATTDPWAVLSNLTLTSAWNHEWWQSGNPVSWSLVCEAFFYLVFPFAAPLVRRLERTPLVLSLIAAVLMVIAGPLVSQTLSLPISAATSPVMRLPEFVSGILLARLLRNGWWSGPALPPAIALTAAGYGAALTWPDSAGAFSGFTIVGFCLLIAALARTDFEGAPTALASRTLVQLGTLSFPFYLVHLLVIQAIAAFYPHSRPSLETPEALALTGLALAVGLGSAWALHRVIEVPGHRLILTKWTENAPARTPRPALARTA